MKQIVSCALALALALAAHPAHAANSSPATATELTLGSPAADHLDDYYTPDYFRFTTPGDGRVTLRFQHADLNDTYKYWDLALYDSTGTVQLLTPLPVRGNRTDSSWEIGLPAGSYLVRVRASMDLSTVPYSVQASFTAGPAEREPNESPAAANPVLFDTTYTGGFQNRSVTDQDWFGFQLPSDGNLTLSVNQALQSPYSWRVSVLDATATTVYLRSDLTGAPGERSFDLGLPAGSYLVSVTPYTPYGLDDGAIEAFSAGPYALRLGFQAGGRFEKELNDTPAGATAATLNQTWSGFIQPKSGSDWDYYRISLPGPGTLPVEITSPFFTFYDGTGTTTVFSKPQGSATSYQVPFPAGGDYLLLATGSAGSPYTFRVGYPDLTPPAVLQATPAPGSTVVSRAISVQFSEPLDPASVSAGSLTLDKGVTGTATLNGSVLSFTPDRPLSHATTYSATVKGSVRDLGGNPLGADYHFSFSTASEAGSARVPKTGQVTCYATDGSGVDCQGTGQDAELRHGIPWPDPRFDDNRDGTVTDHLTGLMWAQQGNLMATRDPGFDTSPVAGDGSVPWKQALAYVTKLNQENYLGYSDWRLPNLNEMESLILDTLQEDSRLWLNSLGFTNLQPSYWTSSRKTEYWIGWNKFSWNVWLVNLETGQRDYDHGYSPDYVDPAVLPVRTAGPGAVRLPATGITSCVDQDSFATIACAGTGQDGELKEGVAPAAERFRVEGGVVADTLTGLSWPREANLVKNRDPGYDASGDGKVTWQQALDYVKKLNAEKYLGFADWRLPNRRELTTLADFGSYDNAARLPMTGFATGNLYYWSSTNLGLKADAMSFFDGSIYRASKLDTYFVIPVREGGNGVLSSSPGRHDFGTVQAGSPAARQTLVISNNSDRTLSFGAPALTGAAAAQFSVGAGGPLPCAAQGQSLASGQWCSVEVGFLPATGGPKSATLEFTLSGASAPALSVPLAGSAVKTSSVLTLTIGGSGAGTVNSTPAGLACGFAQCSAEFPVGSQVTLLATPDADSLFSGWSGGGCGGLAGCELTLDDDLSVAAAFSYVMPVRAAGAPPRYFYGLQTAYDWLPAGDDAFLDAREVRLTGDLTLSRDLRVTLKGGWDRLFAAKSGRTALRGKLSIRNGVLRAERLAVQ